MPFNFLLTIFIFILISNSWLSFAMDSIPSQSKVWHVCGYLSHRPLQKSCLTLRDGLIIEIQDDYAEFSHDHPHTLIFETDDFISPGLIDLYNQLPYNLFNSKLMGGKHKNYSYHPEWQKLLTHPSSSLFLNGQIIFQNKENFCLSLLWAEIKAITGGVTLLNGPSLQQAKSQNCHLFLGAKNFLTLSKGEGQIPNPELNDFPRESTLQAFHHNILPLFQKNRTYKEVIEIFIRQSKILESFQKISLGPKTFSYGLGIIWGNKAKKFLRSIPPLTLKLLDHPNPLALAPQELSTLKKTLLPLLKSHLKNKSQVDFTLQWFFGKDQFFSFSHQNKKKLPLDKVLELFHHPANISYPQTVKDFVVAFHFKTLKKIQRSSSFPIGIPLADGKHSNPLTHQEMTLWQTTLANQGNFFFIHGTGLNQEERNFLQKKNIFLLWTPSRDLFLYDETLSPPPHIPWKGIGLGSTGSLMGSQNLLQEIQFLSHHLEEKSPEEIFTLATSGNAKFLGFKDQVGEIKVGAQADFFLFTRRKNNLSFYQQLSKITEEDIHLVSLKGRPVYGDFPYLSEVMMYFQDIEELQVLPLYQINTPSSCTFEKFLAIPHFPSLLEIKQKLLSTYSASRDKLWTSPEKANALIHSLDPFLSCERKAE